jgi:cytochrome c-type biogenesis protein CcmE
MLQSVSFDDAVEKAVMDSRYLAKVNFLGIKPQMYTENLSVFICGFLFADSDFC